jgi:hypothetical protein
VNLASFRHRRGVSASNALESLSQVSSSDALRETPYESLSHDGAKNFLKKKVLTFFCAPD